MEQLFYSMQEMSTPLQKWRKNLYKCNLEDHLHRRKRIKSKNSITSSLNYYEWSNNYSTRCKRCLHLYKNDNWHFQNIYAIWRIIFIEEKRPSPKTLYVTSSLNHHERSNNYSTRCKRCLHLDNWHFQNVNTQLGGSSRERINQRLNIINIVSISTLGGEDFSPRLRSIDRSIAAANPTIDRHRCVSPCC